MATHKSVLLLPHKPKPFGLERQLFPLGALLHFLFCFVLQRPKLQFCNFVTFCRNEAVVISGRKLAQQIKQEVRQEVEDWVASGNKRPHLSVILVGDNPASHSYVLNKTRAAAEVGKCCVRALVLLPWSLSEVSPLLYMLPLSEQSPE